MPSPPSRCSPDRPFLDPKPQQQQQPPADDQRPKAKAFAMRKQWQAKAASFQRGLEHVQKCHAGDACGSSLCHSTRRLMKTYATHPCPTKNSPDSDCRVCKLWDFLMASQQLPRQERALAQVGRSCGSELIEPRRLTRPSALLRRIDTVQNEAQTMTRRL